MREVVHVDSMPDNRRIEKFSNRPALFRSAVRVFVVALLLSSSGHVWAQKRGQKPAKATAENRASPVPEELMLNIVRAEDERRWGDSLSTLLFDRNAQVRRRAALAAGRIGDERAVSALATLLQSDRDVEVREMAAFALGEVESATGADALLAALARASETSQVRARIVEAIGKVAAALPKAEEGRGAALGQAVLSVLDREAGLGPRSDRRTVLLGLTAALRAHPDRVGPVLGKFLSHKDWRVRADALNALARLSNKDANDLVRPLLASDAEAIVRANAARVLGTTEDKASVDALVARATTDVDERVRVSSIRALAALKEQRAAAPLLGRGGVLLAAFRTSRAAGVAHPREAGELLEIATALGRLLANRGDVRAVAWLKEFRTVTDWSEPEIEIALAHIAPAAYLRDEPFSKLSDEAVRARLRRDWRVVSATGQALGEIGRIAVEEAGSGVVGLQADAQIILRSLLDDATLPSVGVPDLLRALAAFKPPDAGALARKYLGAKDPLVRAAAADLLGELGPDEENARALAAALPGAMRDELNDAALSTLDALARQKSALANDAIKTALDSTDVLVRRRAIALLKANEAGDFSSRLGQVATRNTVEDYRRALLRRNGRVRATVTTDKGSFIIELLPEDAPLTVDNFVQLARRGYFDGVRFHRVVPNFVIQGGDPRGDGNGGPGYQIRCEINEVEYERGAVGMALSGKDTGGSQWFVTHSPQPHLDGGYTVFGRVEASASLEVVDAIERGDKIQSITIAEGAAAPAAQKPTSRAGK